MITITQADNGKTVSLKVCDPLQVDLPENGGTGFRWQEQKTTDLKVLTLNSTEFLPPDSNKMGAGGTRRWSYTVTSTGKSTLRFVYRRPWEAATAPAKTFEITIQAAE